MCGSRVKQHPLFNAGQSPPNSRRLNRPSKIFCNFRACCKIIPLLVSRPCLPPSLKFLPGCASLTCCCIFRVARSAPSQLPRLVPGAIRFRIFCVPESPRQSCCFGSSHLVRRYLSFGPSQKSTISRFEHHFLLSSLEDNGVHSSRELRPVFERPQGSGVVLLPFWILSRFPGVWNRDCPPLAWALFFLSRIGSHVKSKLSGRCFSRLLSIE